MTVTSTKLNTILTHVEPAWIRRNRVHQPPLLLLIAALLVAGAALLPLGYLLIRAAGAGGAKVVDIMLRPRTIEVFLASAGLAMAVTLASVMIGVLLAWLTVRTDLPGRRFWAVATVLPLTLPSFVGAFTLIAALGPRGIVQDWLEPLGVERLPSIYGFPGALMALDPVYLPLRVAHGPGRSARPGPQSGRGGPQHGPRPVSGLLGDYLAPSAALHLRRWFAGGSLHPE